MFDLDQAKPIFICGHRRSGTTLLVALLDDHPQLNVYPDESKFFYLFYPKVAQSGMSREEKIEHIIEKHFAFFKDVLATKTHAPPGYIDHTEMANEFRHYIVSRKKVQWHDYLQGMICAYAHVSLQDMTSVVGWVEKTTSSEIFASDIDQAFRDAKFIHIVRDPRDNYSSLKSGWEKRYRHLDDSSDIEDLRESCIMRGLLGMKMGILNQQVLGKKKYRIIRYEDVVKHPEETLNKLSAFLNIDYHPSLLVPTICGLPWKGNNFEGKQFDGIRSTRVGQWKNRIGSEEAALMEFHFSEMMTRFNYEPIFSEKEQLQAAQQHYEWINFYSKRRADYRMVTKSEV